MADDITHTSTSPAGPPNNTKQVTDEHATRGHMPLVKLAYSADGDATHVPADANGLTVKQGTAAQLNCTEASASAIKTAVEIMDDWDETDRAKVNPIVGQAGVAAGAGAVGATVQRVTLASDDPAVASLATIDDIVQTEDAAHSTGHKGVMLLAVRNDAHAALAGTDGDYIPLCTDSSGDLHVSIQNNASVVVASALPAGTNNIGDVDVLSIAAGDNNIGNVDIVTVPSDPFGANADAAATAGSTGTMQAKFRLMTSQLDSIKTAVETLDNTVGGSELQVDVVTMPNAVVAGNVASDAADSGNPVKIGGMARTSEITAVASGDRVDFIADTVGKQVVLPYAIPEKYVYGVTSDITNTTSTSVIAAPGASLRNYITQLNVGNSHASQGTWVNITDGSGGTTMQTIFAASGGGGATVTFPTPLRQTANTALHAVCGTTGANVRVSASGFIAP